MEFVNFAANKTFFHYNIRQEFMILQIIKISYHKILDKCRLILIFSLLLAAVQTTAQNSFSLVEPADFEVALRQNPNAILIDLRNVDSYMKGHIRKATVIDFLRDDFKEYFLTKYNKDTPLFVYAQSSENSRHAGLYISELGYTQVTALKGGFENWIRKSKPYKSASGDFKPLSYVSKENYSQMLREKKWTLVLFHEDYCKGCDNLDTTLRDLKSEFSDLNFAKINFQTNVELAEWVNVTKNPTVLLYREGVQYQKFSGEITKERIKQLIY